MPARQSAEMRKALRLVINKNMKPADAAKKAGVSKNGLSQALKAAGVPTREQTRTRTDHAYALVLGGMTQRQAAKEAGVSPGTVATKVHREKLKLKGEQEHESNPQAGQ